MNSHKHGTTGIALIALLSLVTGWGVSYADDASVAGAYSLIEVNGEPLPVNGWTEMLDGERCAQVILKGVLLLDSEGRSAAFLTENVSCPSKADQEDAVITRSVIFAGSYTAAGNKITIVDDFGTDHAVVEEDILIYETGGEGRPVEEFVFKKD